MSITVCLYTHNHPCIAGGSFALDCTRQHHLPRECVPGLPDKSASRAKRAAVFVAQGGAPKNPLFPLIASLWVPAEWIKWSFPGGRGRRRKALPHLPLLMSQLRKCRCGSAAPLLHVENFFRWRYCTGLTIFVTVLPSIRHGRWPKYPIDKKYQ